MIGAILWAQWKSSRLVRFGGGKRGAWFSSLTSIIWYLFWVVAAIGTAAFAADPNLQNDIRSLFPAVLVFTIVYWQLAPVLVASLGAALDLKKLLVYPIPTEKLFFVDVLLRISTGLEMMLLLSGAGVGLLMNPAFGGWMRSPRIIAPLLLFVLFNLLLAAGLRGVVERMLGQKRVREVFVVLLVMMAAVPQLLIVTGIPKTRLLHILTENASILWPWMATSRLMLSGSAAAPWAAMFCWTAAAATCSAAGSFTPTCALIFRPPKPPALPQPMTKTPGALGCIVCHRRCFPIRSAPLWRRIAHSVAHASIPAGIYHGLYVWVDRVASARLRTS